MNISLRLTLLVSVLFATTSGCAAARLLGYEIAPGTPRFESGSFTLAGLHAPVAVRQSSDGLWHIKAADEHDLFLTEGYLQARDRMAQLDLFRRLARGRMSALVGDMPFGDKNSVEADLYNQALDFAGQGHRLYATASPEERAAVDAAVAGVNAWIATGTLPLEHRLLGAKSIEPWSVDDSLAIYEMLMFNLSSNANREIRRLLLACAAGVDAAERIWPTDIDFGAPALPAADFPQGVAKPAPAVVPEVRAALPALCPPPKKVESASTHAMPQDSPLAWAAVLLGGLEASNSWVVSGARTASGKPVLANDPQIFPPVGCIYLTTIIAGEYIAVFGRYDNTAPVRKTDSKWRALSRVIAYTHTKHAITTRSPFKHARCDVEIALILGDSRHVEVPTLPLPQERQSHICAITLDRTDA